MPSDEGFRPSLWDDSEPLYAPGLKYVGQSCYWRPSSRFQKLGYPIRSARLDGHKGDGGEFKRAAECRERTREMLRWMKKQGTGVQPGTWDFLIGRYKTDQWSPFHDIKPNTRQSYLDQFKVISKAAGKARLKDASYTEFRKWITAMEKNGRTVSYIKRVFTHIRILVNYGVMVEMEDCDRLAAVLSKMRIQSAEPRAVAATAEDVKAIVAAADRDGQAGFALGVLMQWWFGLRAVDVRGQWLKCTRAELSDLRKNGGIYTHTKRWADGLTWQHIDPDVTTIRKVQSKVRRTRTDTLQFDLTLVPEIRERLLAVPKDRRIGPVILRPNGKPFAESEWPRLWAYYRDKCGLSADLRAMDLRAGAASDAGARGATPFDLRDAMGHANVTTTDRYVRGRAEGISRVVKLRRGEQ